MKYHFFILVLLSLSCQTKTAEQNAAKDSTAVVDSPTSPTAVSAPVPVQEPVPSTYPMGTETDFDAVLLPGAQIFADSTDESRVVRTEIKTLMPIQTHTISTLASPVDADICSQYYWHNISMGVEDGWVYGDHLLQGTKSAPYTPLDIAGTLYKLFYLVDAGIGPSNKEGLTGCNQYYIPYLWNNEKGTMHFIQSNNVSLPNNSFATSYDKYGWLSFISSEGGAARIQSISYTKSESNFYVFLNVSYQDGGAKFQMVIGEREGDLVLQSFNEINEDNN